MIRYKKHDDPAMDAAFEAAQPFGHIRVGGGWIFARKGFAWNAVEASQVARVWRRVQQVTGRTCCATNDFNIHHLMLLMKDGTQNELLIGESMYRSEPERLVEVMQAMWPEIAYGKPGAAQA